MCCCASPNINGQPGYSWDGKHVSTRPINPPSTDRTILYDEPGRCGGQDSHCHHYRVVGSKYGAQFPSLLVRHGGGDEEVRLSNGKGVLAALALLDSNGRYWLLNAIYHAHADANQAGKEVESNRWQHLFLARRLKRRTRKGMARIEILPDKTTSEVPA